MSSMAELFDVFFNGRKANPEPVEAVHHKVVVACRANCGRVATIAWSSGVKCKVVSFTCKCGTVTPIDGGGEHEAG